MALRLNMETWGTGPPGIVLLHGLGDGAFVWSHVAPVLAAYTAVAAVELRGHGDSPRDPQGCYLAATYAQDVVEAISRIAARPVTVVGHSLGAIVAVHVSRMAREKLHGLVLVDGGPGMNPKAIRHIHQQFRAQPWEHESVDSFALGLQDRYPLADPQLLQDIARRALKPLPSGKFELKCDRALLGEEQAADDTVLWEGLKSFDGPLLVIHGAGSAALSRQSAVRMASESPHGRAHTVPIAGHTVMLDNPAGFLLPLERFLAELLSNPYARKEAML